MNTDEIKHARRNGYSTWEILHMVVDAGKEFPDAEWLVSRALKLDDEERAEMVDAYDNNA